MDSFLPHVDTNLVSEDVFCNFVADRDDTFLAVTKLKSKMESADLENRTETVVKRLSMFQGTFRFDQDDSKSIERKRCTFWECYLFGILEHHTD
jgi:hypothetical protein